MKRFLSLLGYLFFVQIIEAQVIIYKFIPGDFRFNNFHRVELQNVGSKVENISNFLIITRDYGVKIPDKTFLKPGQKYILGKKNDKFQPNLDLKSTKDFLFKPYRKKIEGNYVVLFSSTLTFIDGFYHSQLKDVPFLPEKNSLILGNGNIIHYEIPVHTFGKWKFYPIGDDPAIGFEQIQGKWRITSAQPGKNIYSQIIVKNFRSRYVNKVVNLTVETASEENLKIIVLERSEKNLNFQRISSLKASNRLQGSKYQFADSDVKPNTIYYYRIASLDHFNQWSYSKVIEIETKEITKEFWVELFPIRPNENQDISLHFFSAFSQKISIRLVNDKMREIGSLFHDFAYADKLNLLKIKKLPKGKYIIIVFTEVKRFFYRFEVV